MSLTLTVDGDRWRAHLRGTANRLPGLVPVAKGNGYGFTVGALARRAGWLGVDTLAVGTYHEIDHVASRFGGSLLVLTPWRPFSPQLPPPLSPRVIHTVGRLADLADLLAHDRSARIVLERRTSMIRHGFDARRYCRRIQILRQGVGLANGYVRHRKIPTPSGLQLRPGGGNLCRPDPAPAIGRRDEQYTGDRHGPRSHGGLRGR